MNSTNHAIITSPSSITISRDFSVSQENLFKVWTKSRHLINWWGPEGYTMPSHKMDIHPSGIFRCNIKPPNDKDHWAHGVFKEMVEPNHIAFTFSWEENDQTQPETYIAVELSDQNNITNMVFHQSGLHTDEQKYESENFWSQSFDRLEKYLQSINDF